MGPLEPSCLTQVAVTVYEVPAVSPVQVGHTVTPVAWTGGPQSRVTQPAALLTGHTVSSYLLHGPDMR